jgi:hypothetical protein
VGNVIAKKGKMENVKLVELQEKDLTLIKEVADLELVRKSVDLIKDIQLCPSIEQWNYTLENSIITRWKFN